LLPPPDIEIALEASGSGRNASLRASSPTGIAGLENTASRFALSPCAS
jgi:hypothetical protein